MRHRTALEMKVSKAICDVMGVKKKNKTEKKTVKEKR